MAIMDIPKAGLKCPYSNAIDSLYKESKSGGQAGLTVSPAEEIFKWEDVL